MRIAKLLVLAGLAGLVVLPSHASVLPRPLHDETQTSTYTASVTSVMVHTDVGRVDVSAGSPTTVTSRARWNVVEPTITRSLSNGVLTVRAECPDFVVSLINDCAVDLRLAVPGGASLSASSDVGSTNVSGLAGPSVSADTGVGDVHLSGIGAGIVTANAGTGSISALLATAPSAVDLDAGTGSVDLRLPSGTYRVEATAGVGDVSVTGITDSDSASRTIKAHAGVGDVTIQGY